MSGLPSPGVWHSLPPFEGPFNSYSMEPGLPSSISTGAPYNPNNAAQGMTGLIRVR